MQVESSKAAIGSSMFDAEKIKVDIKSKIPERKITSIWSKVTDTNVGSWDYEVFKQRRQIDDTLSGVYNGSMAFFEIMTGRRKISPKYLSLEQLRNWWQDVYVPLDDGYVSEH